MYAGKNLRSKTLRIMYHDYQFTKNTARYVIPCKFASFIVTIMYILMHEIIIICVLKFCPCYD